ncbi:MAG: hypothetical protein IAG13_09565 [Deltaproteobacteria bacterium]|nr:hypothetical protein [Nannocystaceae bacterium]
MRRALFGFAWLGVACRDEIELRSGLDQPVRVEDAFFREDEIAVAQGGPELTSLEATSSIALLGQAGRSLAGRADDDTWAIGVRFAALGSGWWIREVGDLAAQYPGERDFALTYDLGAGIPPGIHALRMVAIDADGRRGAPTDFDLCVLDDAAAAGLNPCDPTLPPPALVLGAAWNRDVDLDLVVEGPDGKQVRWKSPTTAQPVDGVVPERELEDPAVGKLDRDSNAACIADGRNSESVVWEELPPAGVWSAYVDLFDACGEADVTFTVSVYRRRQRDDGTWYLEEIERRTGNLVAQFDVYGGAKPPLYVLSTELP